MVLSQRERNILIVALATVAFLVLYYAVISPYLDWQKGSLARQEMLQKKVQEARGVIELRARTARQWKEMVQPAIKSDPAEAESQIFHAFDDWAAKSGVVVTLQKSQRSAEKTRLPEIMFQEQGTGTMKSLAGLLWKIQTAGIPIRVTDLAVDSRRDGQDDLMFKFSLSTVYTLPPAFASSPGGHAAAGGSR
jgi:hypothetical protein